MTEDFEHILYAVAEGVATITLNRPEKLNAYVPEMGGELVAAFRHARGSDGVRAVILTGAGRGFCAGVDLEALKASYSVSAVAKGPKLGEEDFVRKLPLELWEFPKPIIAAINGHAIGVGVTMTLPCDIRLAAEDAKIGLTFAKLGILPGLGSTNLLPRLVGMAKAQELVLGAEVIRGIEAARIGLVNRAVPGERLLDEAHALAGTIAAHDPDVIAAAKRSLHEGAALSLPDAMKNEQKRAADLRRLRTGRSS